METNPKEKSSLKKLSLLAANILFFFRLSKRIEEKENNITYLNALKAYKVLISD